MKAKQKNRPGMKEQERSETPDAASEGGDEPDPDIRPDAQLQGAAELFRRLRRRYRFVGMAFVVLPVMKFAVAEQSQIFHAQVTVSASGLGDEEGSSCSPF